MITAVDVNERLRGVPFQPFKIVTSSGASYEVTHPDTVLVSRRVLYVGIYEANVPSIPERVASVSVLHVTELVPLPATANTP